ncbi:hypothetical protein [Brunnivagina elsteri]|uniref:hypothetical protein n=1 Tax=Brunnivagina elsteri TaxID=1247191 RepID=UPI0013042B38|nr:hypothetical protein [Calothrix elsteri]
MVSTDDEAQVKAQGTRGNEKTVQFGIDSDRSTGLRRESLEIGGKPLSVDRDDRTRGNFIDERRQAIPGGIVDRLISNVSEEIAEIEARLVDRTEYLKELKQLSQELHKKPENKN